MTSMVNGSLGAFARQDLAVTVEIFDAETERDKLLRIAPPMSVRTRHSRAYKQGTANLLDLRETSASAQTWNAAAQTNSFKFDSFDVDVYRYSHDSMIITTHDSSEASEIGDVDLEAEWMSKASVHAYSIHAYNLGQTLTVDGNYDASLVSSSLSFAAQTADLSGAILAAQRAFRDLGVGARNLIAVCSDAVLDAMTSLDQVREAVAITGYTTSGASVRRTGTVTGAEVIDWFRGKYGIELIVLETRIINASGTAVSPLDKDLYILHADESPLGKSFIKTAALETANGGALLTPWEYPSYNPAGKGLYAETIFGLPLPSNKLGFAYTGVIA